MDAPERNKTWKIVDKPNGNNLIGCKWVYTVKYKADDSLKRFISKAGC